MNNYPSKVHFGNSENTGQTYPITLERILRDSLFECHLLYRTPISKNHLRKSSFVNPLLLCGAFSCTKVPHKSGLNVLTVTYLFLKFSKLKELPCLVQLHYTTCSFYLKRFRYFQTIFTLFAARSHWVF